MIDEVEFTNINDAGTHLTAGVIRRLLLDRCITINTVTENLIGFAPPLIEVMFISRRRRFRQQ